MSEPNNGKVLGGGAPEPRSSKVRHTMPVEDTRDQFEIENDVTPKLPGDIEPETPLQTSKTTVSREKVTRDVSDIMSTLLSANLDDLRITKFGIELNGEHKLKISFGKEHGRMLTLYMDGTWKYEA